MLDPVTSFAVGHVASKVLDRVTSSFRSNVIERWSRQRAAEFFDEFCARVSVLTMSTSTEALELSLDHIVEDEVCSEVLFDAYRHVTLARSRKLGPRIIALLCAELVVNRKTAGDDDDAMFLAAETLTDGELVEFVSFVRKEQSKAKPTAKLTRGLRISWMDEKFDTEWAEQGPVSIAPLDTRSAMGTWAAKLQSLGIIRPDIEETQRHYSVGERASLNAGTERYITWWIEVPGQFLKLVDLIERASHRSSQEHESPIY